MTRNEAGTGAPRPKLPDARGMLEAGMPRADVMAVMQAHRAAVQRWYASLPDGAARRAQDLRDGAARLRAGIEESRAIARQQDGSDDEGETDDSLPRLAAALGVLDAADVMAAASEAAAAEIEKRL